MTGPGDSDDSPAYFASVAGTYDRLQPIVAGPGYTAGLAMMVDLVPYERDECFQFIDLGCGTGALTQGLLDRFPRAQGIAIDSESAMLGIARRKLAPYGGRVEARQDDMLSCGLPSCDVVLSSTVFHHVPAENLPELLGRIAHALRAEGCFALFDHMTAGLAWGEGVRDLSRRLYRRHVAEAVADGRATQEELDARWAFKRKMKEEGKDLEYSHSAEQLLDVMQQEGFAEVGLVWRMFTQTILVGFV